MNLSRTVVLTDYAAGPSVVDLRVPDLQPGEILVEVSAATVCGTDVHIAAGNFPQLATLPLVMGHEGTGRVVATNGRSVDVNGRDLTLGSSIVWAHPWCGHCFSCAIAEEPTICENTAGYGWGPSPEGRLNGTFSEFFIVSPESKVLRVSDRLDPALVSSATCALRTVMHAMTRIPRIRFSDQVVVLGSGPVGLYAAAVAVASGAAGVHMIGGPKERLTITDEWGLATCFDIFSSTHDERRAEILDRTVGRGADVVIECAGPAVAFNEGLDVLRRGGSYLVLGQAHRETVSVNTTGLKVRQQNVVTSLSAEIVHFHEAMSFLERYADRFQLAQMVESHHFNLDHVSDALAVMRSGEAMKPVIYPTYNNPPRKGDLS
ncbi:MAG: alcohol dehydrogenase catalytic domain-containing protein [Actinomycetota bacterium]|nr:alcohol dehydrogenase catalytic domain-containing protein [Actinomycetota bacterium]